jgi:hypothetical protein
MQSHKILPTETFGTKKRAENAGIDPNFDSVDSGRKGGRGGAAYEEEEEEK